MLNRMRPIHPGEHLRLELEEIGLSPASFALELAVPQQEVEDVLAERRGMTAEFALRLSRYFGTSAEFWLNLQTAYELRAARATLGDEIERTVRPRAA
jgi:addiction module HigA family antidote